MTYAKNDKIIVIQMEPLIGNVRPELLVGESNQLLKVATFGSIEKAMIFEEWLRYFFSDNLVKEGDK